MRKLLITAPFVDNFRGKIMKFVYFFWPFHQKTVSLPPELKYIVSNDNPLTRKTTYRA